MKYRKYPPNTSKATAVVMVCLFVLLVLVLATTR